MMNNLLPFRMNQSFCLLPTTKSSQRCFCALRTFRPVPDLISFSASRSRYSSLAACRIRVPRGHFFPGCEPSPPLNPLQCALPRFAPLTPIESALPKTQHLKSFRMSTSGKKGRGVPGFSPVTPSANSSSRFCYSVSFPKESHAVASPQPDSQHRLVQAHPLVAVPTGHAPHLLLR